MKKIFGIVLLISFFTLSGCHRFHHHGHGHDENGHCPPGQAKKGNC